MKLILAAAGTAALLATPATAQDSAKALADAFAAAVMAEDADALAALYTEDADSFGPGGGVAHGRAEIAASWAPTFDAFDDIIFTIDAKGDKALGKDAHAAWGLWTITMTPASGGEPLTMSGRFSDNSIKTKEGWRYFIDHASAIAVPAEEAPTE